MSSLLASQWDEGFLLQAAGDVHCGNSPMSAVKVRTLGVDLGAGGDQRPFPLETGQDTCKVRTLGVDLGAGGDHAVGLALNKGDLLVGLCGVGWFLAHV